MYTYKRWNVMEICNGLASQGESSDFTTCEDDLMLDQLEKAAIAIDINFDADLAMMAIKNGSDLSDSLWASQVEFCCG